MTSVWESPDEASAGRVAIVVVGTAPPGAFFGAFWGARLAVRSPRVFSLTILPLSILLLAFCVTFAALESMDRPRTFVVEVDGTPGAEYAARVRIDGKGERHRGTTPARFEARCRLPPDGLALVDRDQTKQISVHVQADGRELPGGFESPIGMFLRYESQGYSDSFGGTSGSWICLQKKQIRF